MSPIKTFSDLQTALVDDADEGAIFRGVRSIDYKLVPKICRIKKFSVGVLQSNEQIVDEYSHYCLDIWPAAGSALTRSSRSSCS